MIALPFKCLLSADRTTTVLPPGPPTSSHSPARAALAHHFQQCAEARQRLDQLMQPARQLDEAKAAERKAHEALEEVGRREKDDWRAWSDNPQGPPPRAREDERSAGLLALARAEKAVRSYRRSFSDGRGDERIGKITAMSVRQFKRWLGFQEALGRLRRSA